MKTESKTILNPVLNRLTEFAENKGGASKVYGKIGKQVSTYWNLVRNNSKPSVDTLIMIADEYPDFDLNYVLTGKNNSEVVKQLEMQVNILTNMYEKQMIKNSGSIEKN